MHSTCTRTHNKYVTFRAFQRLKAKIFKLVDVSYGGMSGLNQAIDLSTEVLGNLKFVQEKKLIGKSVTVLCTQKSLENWSILTFASAGAINYMRQRLFILVFSCFLCVCANPKTFSGKYFDEISQNTSKFCFGVDDTFRALEMGALETLIVWENLDIKRYVLRNHTSNGKFSIFITIS